MLQPIQKEHEMICPGCGCVLAHVEEYNEITNKSVIPVTVDMFLLGSAIENSKKHIGKTPQIIFEERTLKNIRTLVSKYSLPERFVLETFNELKRKRRGFQSEYAYIKQLLQILSKDENYIHVNTYRKIKARYESIFNY